MLSDPKTIAGMQQALLDDCAHFLPELILCGSIVLLLLLRLFRAANSWHLGWETLTLTLVALIVAFRQWQDNNTGTQTPGASYMFGGLLVYDNFTIFLRLFLLGFTALTIWLSILTGIPDTEDSADFYTLLLGGTVGMMIMASANHLLMVFIGVEMASLPSFALAGFLKGRRQSSEAALKYVVYGGGAAGVMLYGISLIAGKFGTGFLPDLARVLPAAVQGGLDPVLLLGLLFIMVGLAFKLSAVPFHFWCPDVFEGAAAEVAAFLSVASKGAALALLGRLAFTLVGGLDSVETLARYLVPTIALFAAITATFGNLAAYPQTNIKRLLAYSTIAHAGYMMMGLAPLTEKGATAVLFYLVTYVFMNLGAFAVVAFVRNQTGSEDLADYRGLIYRAPVLGITLSIFLLSLLGIPPLAGFAAKFQIFAALFTAGQDFGKAGQDSLSMSMYALLVVGGINTVVSAIYYLRVMKVMIIDQPVEVVEGKEAPQLPLKPTADLFLTALALMIFVLGIFWSPLADASKEGLAGFPKAKNEPSATVGRAARD